MDLSVKYLGLKIKNPIVVGSSGLSATIEGVKKLSENGPGAIVLKSLFEEQIVNEINVELSKNTMHYAEAVYYIKNYTKEKSVTEYLKLIRNSKEITDIPIIASINCVSDNNWIDFTEKVEDAGADAIELNISLLPADDEKSGEENEKLYFNISEKVRSQVSIPIALKMSQYSSGLANLIKKLSWTNFIDGFVLFNRYYKPDIDIDKLKIKSSGVFSTPDELSTSLRWIAILSGIIKKQLIPSTGIHDAKGVIKQVLSGAEAVQIVSAIYKNGPQYIKTILTDLEKWMTKNSYNSISDFKGKIHDEMPENKAVFERIQYMKYYGGIN